MAKRLACRDHPDFPDCPAIMRGDTEEEIILQAQEHGRQAQWRAALNVLGLEAKIVQIYGRDLLAKRSPTNDDTERLILACNRIDDAREVLNARAA